MTHQVEVSSVSPSDILHARNIDFIDTYVSDIQGMDLAILKTLSTFVNEKKIGEITCEATKNRYGNIYEKIGNSI